MKMKQYSILALASIFALASCSEEKGAASSSTSEEDSSLSALVIKEEPAKAIDISDLRKTAKAGDLVTFSGDVLGSMNVFMDGRAVMILGDPKKMTACNLIPGDECETPWDVCCDDPDVIKNSIVTVQALDNDGKLIKEGLKGLAEIKELTNVVVTGTVADSSTASNMLINASGIYVKQ